MLFDLFSEDFDMLDLIIKLFSRLFVVFCTMPIHEYAHALIATKLGDQTPRLAGRLTLNPMAHISSMGAVMIFLFGFGYAKPVSVNPRNFKDSKKGMALTAIAGPISNLIMGFIFIVLAVVYANLSHAETILYNATPEYATQLSELLAGKNCMVNLIPWNAVDERDFASPSGNAVHKFQDILIKNGIHTRIRRERGTDIGSACGQLRLNNAK